MSFGWGAGEIVTAIKVSKQIYDALSASTDEYVDYKQALMKINTTMCFLDDYDKNLFLDPEDPLKRELEALVVGAKARTDRLLQSLQVYLRFEDVPNHASPVEWFKKQGAKLKWHFLDEKDLRKQKDEALGDIKLIDIVIQARERRQWQDAFREFREITASDHRSLMAVASHIDRATARSYNAILYEKIQGFEEATRRDILASGQMPEGRPSNCDLNTSSKKGVASALQLLESRLPMLTSPPATQEKLITMDFRAKDTFEHWLERGADVSCLWLRGDDAGRVSRSLTALRREEKLLVIHCVCQRFDMDGEWLEPEQVLEQVSFPLLQQLLCYILDEHLSKPGQQDLQPLERLNDNSDATNTVLGVAASLLREKVPPLVWVIEDYDRLKDDDLEESPSHSRALKRLLLLFGVGQRDIGDAQRCLVASKGGSALLNRKALDEEIDLFPTAEHFSHWGNYNFSDEIRTMMLRQK